MNPCGNRCPFLHLAPFILLAGLGCAAAQEMADTDPNLAIQFPLDSVSLQPGDSIPMSGRVSGAGHNETITIAVSGLPAGVTAHVAEPPTTASGVASIVFASGAAVVPGRYRFTISASTTNNGRASVGMDLRIVPASATSYRIIAPASPVVIAPNQEIDVPLGLTRTGYTGAVVLLADHLPAGLNGFFHPNPVTSDSTVLELRAAVSDTVGTYLIWVRGLTADLADQIVAFPVSIVVNSAVGIHSAKRNRQ